MLVLTDHTVTSGGFCCVPKFHTKFKDWGVEHPVDSVEGASINHHLIYVPKEDPIQSQVEKILMKAGRALIHPLLTYQGRCSFGILACHIKIILMMMILLELFNISPSSRCPESSRRKSNKNCCLR